MPYSVKVEDFESFQSEWERILPQCPSNTIFVTPWWQRIWWEHFGDGADLRILSVWDEDELIGIAPLMLNGGVLPMSSPRPAEAASRLRPHRKASFSLY